MAKSTKKNSDLYLCFDLGGTKLRAALITSRGQIKAVATGNVNQKAGLPGLLDLFKELEQQLPKLKYKSISVASAGPLHPASGVLLDPTNFFTSNKAWGVVPIVAHLKKIFRKPVILENDAAAAVLGEMWKGGHGKKSKNVVAMTLGTGVGVGVITDGLLVRAGRGLHPEGGHIPINAEDKNYPCGCGAYGCIEAYLAGTHFAKRMSARVGRTLTGKEAVALAEDGDLQIQASFKEYGRHLAQAIRSLCVMFAPEVVVLSGGFSHASSLFLPETQKVLPAMLERYREGIDLLPEVKVSKLLNDAGILGAAYIASHK